MTNSQRTYGNRRAPLPPAGSLADGVPSPRTTHTESEPPAGRRRDAFFDNAKYLAIVLVAVGHAWGQLLDDRAVETAYRVVYTFHMPAFILISGYFSRGFDLRPKHVKRLITGVIIPYAVFETAYSLFERYGNDNPDHGITLLDPTYHLWFLCALVVWRVTTPVWRTVRHPLAVSLVPAALGSVSPQIGDDLELQRVLQFLPFFVLGLMLRPEHFQRVRHRSVRLMSLPVLALATATAWWSVPRMDLGWLYHKAAAEELNAPWWSGPLMVSGTLACSLLMTVCFFAWVPRRHMWFTALGAGTIYGYLVHGFFVKAGIYAGWFDHPALREPLGVIGLTVLAAAVITLLCTGPVRRTLRCVVEPRMAWAFRQDPAAETARDRAGESAEVRAPGEKVAV
ncbi:acyltransferase family protein [Streptomyces sp. CHD11]|uniref:acyltransferase family protein n=1 Tax=Streptomyces sp. CHD11 TaxID=2741325 RepID=UPI001BFC1DA8|nr:acyltransferase family protein [Streptomyces sp. CHD11]MBT3153451.1 acyltransferase family protein [Streptomyces sp. CHD11]